MAGSFELDIQRFVDKAKGNADLVVRKIALDMFKRVIIKSPVDTGRFKSNWQVAINTIPGGTLGSSGKDKAGNATYDADGSLARVSAIALTSKAGDVIWLVNNVSYANRLEYGWSEQAPKGMVRLSIQEFNSVVAKAANEVPK